MVGWVSGCVSLCVSPSVRRALPCRHDTDYNFRPITFKLHMRRGTLIDLCSGGQRWFMVVPAPLPLRPQSIRPQTHAAPIPIRPQVDSAPGRSGPILLNIKFAPPFTSQVPCGPTYCCTRRSIRPHLFIYLLLIPPHVTYHENCTRSRAVPLCCNHRSIRPHVFIYIVDPALCNLAWICTFICGFTSHVPCGPTIVVPVGRSGHTLLYIFYI